MVGTLLGSAGDPCVGLVDLPAFWHPDSIVYLPYKEEVGRIAISAYALDRSSDLTAVEDLEGRIVGISEPGDIRRERSLWVLECR